MMTPTMVPAMTPSKLMAMDVRPPYRMRAKMSRPRLSVPKKCSALGAA